MSKLYQIRLSKNMTQKDIATELSVGISTYSMYENGLRKVPRPIADKISKILEVDINELFIPSTFTISEC